jgi:hypothetical protein
MKYLNCITGRLKRQCTYLEALAKSFVQSLQACSNELIFCNSILSLSFLSVAASIIASPTAWRLDTCDRPSTRLTPPPPGTQHFHGM